MKRLFYKIGLIILIIFLFYLLKNNCFGARVLPDFSNLGSWSNGDHYFIYYSPNNESYSLIIYSNVATWLGKNRRTSQSFPPYKILSFESSSSYYFNINRYDGGYLKNTRYRLFSDSDSWVLDYGDGNYTQYYYDAQFSIPSNFVFVASDVNIYNNSDVLGNSNLAFARNTNCYYLNPYIINKSDIQNFSFDGVYIDYGMFSTSDKLGLAVFEVKQDYDVLLFKSDYELSFPIHGSKFLFQTNSNTFYYRVPKSFLGINFENDKTYKIIIDNNEPIYTNSHIIYDSVIFSSSNITEQQQNNNNAEIIDSSINRQTKVLQEQNELLREQNQKSTNIFQKIGEILSYINPFSDNFFGRKLVDFIIDGLKSLFIPSNDFFNTYFNDLKSWFQERLGLLWFPFGFLIDLLSRINSINFSEPAFDIPNIYEPFTNTLLINSTHFNFNDLLQNDVLYYVHEIYFILVDGFIIFNLIKLLRDKIEEVFTK